MSSSSENTENTQNDRSAKILRNVQQRLALNNVTNTITAQQNASHQSSIRNLKSSLSMARDEGSRIPQFSKETYIHPSLANSSTLDPQNSSRSSTTNKSIDFLSSKTASVGQGELGSFTVCENKENQDPFSSSRLLPSIREEGHHKSDEEHVLLKSQSSHITQTGKPDPKSSQIFLGNDKIDTSSDYQKSNSSSTNNNNNNSNNNNNNNNNNDSKNSINPRDMDAGKKRPISTLVEHDVPKKFKICDENGEEEYEWEDLDAEDANDPFMVSEYVNEIFDYLSHLEVVTLPSEENLYKHRNIRQNRDILVNWLVKIHNKFGLLPETLYLAINTMDRFLSKELVQLDKLQLVGTSCLFIASKYEEVYSPSIKHFASETDGACTEDEIKEGEKFILKTLNFNLNYPNPMNFLRRISKADDYDIQSRTLAKFLLEISLVDFRFIGILPSLCAAAAMFLSRKMLGKGKWDGNLIHYSGGYTKEQLAPVCHMMMDYLVSPIVHDEFHRKYQSRRFMKASVISVQWALKVRKNGYDIMTLHE
ncbi:hypothetical protein HG535_0F01400 [Zygotorulaspora mrakii]|uniref:Cyclin N-terminal domain-containing protein n=1 Tax=Zygotorulaspora mrakii TaxID=42260 RepID=A0A7H9B6Q4_ZYGMR|nr:uncharacterized protein HG535_0F01400 [Zygotorulaspora mrakii]QLG73629.1 hypothetical protein HG535_0F01400 [Zygotorulaspora mrakii]